MRDGRLRILVLGLAFGGTAGCPSTPPRERPPHTHDVVGGEIWRLVVSGAT